MGLSGALKFGINGIKKAKERAQAGASQAAGAMSRETRIRSQLYDAARLASIISEPVAKGDVFNRKLTGFGKLVAVGFGGAAAVSGAQGQRNQNDMGKNDGSILTATPSMAPYMQKVTGPDLSAGATGDLVFALNSNRESGFL